MESRLSSMVFLGAYDEQAIISSRAFHYLSSFSTISVIKKLFSKIIFTFISDIIRRPLFSTFENMFKKFRVYHFDGSYSMKH
jgi:hypothetical protein